MVGKFRLGKKVPRNDPRTLRFARYAMALAAPPTQELWYKGVPSFGMDGNDTYGDCTIAGAAHLMENWSYNETPPSPVVLSTNDCVNDYLSLTGGADNGLDLLTVLQAWQGNGLVYGTSGSQSCLQKFFHCKVSGAGDDKITAYAALKAGNQLEAQQAVWLFGGAYIGLELPDFAVTGDMLAIPWVVPPGGAVGNAAPNPNNGHCVCIVGYDATQAYVVTWGAVKTMGWDFYAAYSDEGYGIISPDWVGSGVSPPGFDLTQLQADLAAVTG